MEKDMTLKRTVRSIAVRTYNFVKPLLSENNQLNTDSSLVHSYSQNAEDLWVDAILGCKPTGTYVDIGANDPVAFSNTKRFYDRGWSGICIEPNPEKYNKLIQQRERDVVIKCGISETEGYFPFYILDQDMISTFDLPIANNMKLERGAKIVKTLDIPTHRLDSLLDKYLNDRFIDFISIDVEGNELAVLKSNNWEKYNPSAIVIEMSNNTYEIYSYLDKRKYIPVLQNADNTIFIKKFRFNEKNQ